MAAQILAYAGTGKFQTPQKKKTVKTDILREDLRYLAIQTGTKKKRCAQAETADPIDSGNLFMGKVYLAGTVSCTGYKSVQVQRKNENENIKNHKDAFFPYYIQVNNFCLFFRHRNVPMMKKNL